MLPWRPPHWHFFKVILLIKKYQHLTIFYYHDGPCLNIHDNSQKCISETNSPGRKHGGCSLAENILNFTNVFFFSERRSKKTRQNGADVRFKVSRLFHNLKFMFDCDRTHYVIFSSLLRYVNFFS